MWTAFSRARAVISWLAIAICAAATTTTTDAKSLRDRAQVRAFRAENPCPATGRTRGACPGWHVDHIIALCAGGEDHPRNMQWITKEDHRFKTLVDVRECRKAKASLKTVDGGPLK